MTKANFDEQAVLEDYWFWLNGTTDETFDWFVALEAAEERNPAPLIQLLAVQLVPEQVMPFVEDLFNRKLGKVKGGPKHLPLWHVPPLEVFSIMVSYLMENDSLSVPAAVDRIIERFSISIDRDKIIAHFTGKSSYGREWKKKRSILKKVRSDQVS
jgi:hypothetical protein